MNKNLYAAILTTTLLSSTALAHAGHDHSKDTVAPKATQEKTSNSNNELKALKAKLAALDKKVTAQNEAAKNSGLNLNSEKLKIGLDAEFQAGRNFKGDTGKSASAFINSARVILKGRLAPEWGYRFSVDFADEDIGTTTTTLENPADGTDLIKGFDKAPYISRKVAIKDANIQFYGFNPVIIAVGRMFPDMSISRGELFLENPAIAGLLPVNRNGVYISTHGDKWYVSTTLTHSGPGSTDGIDKVSTAWYRKLAIAPINTKENVLHVGGSWVTRFPKTNRYSTTDFNQRPENSLGSILVGTGFLDNIKKTDTRMVDVAYNRGPALIAAEYVRTDVKRNGIANSRFDGWYAQASYALTGESRSYDITSPSFSDIEPAKPFDLANGQFGAFEVKYRYSTVNYRNNEYNASAFAGTSGFTGTQIATTLSGIATGSSHNGAILTINGGKMNMHTVGINWIPNTNLVFMLDYSFGKIKNSQLWGAFYLLDKNSPSATTYKPNYSPKILMFKAKVRI